MYKWGVWSGVSRKFVFGISTQTKREARSALIKKVGFFDSLKYRWKIKEIK